MSGGGSAFLDAEQRTFFAEQGWLVIPGAVSRTRAHELEQEIDKLYATRSARTEALWEMASASRLSPLIAAQSRDPEIAATVAQALGCASVQVLQDTVMVKAPGDGGLVAWHQDHTYTGYLEPARTVSVRLALTECSLEAGCLEVIGGSHSWGPLGDVRALTENHIVDALGPAASRWLHRTVAIELSPGDLSMHHCLTLHRSRENRSTALRKTLITRLFDHACRLVPERLPEHAVPYFPADEQGHLDESSFPIAYTTR